MGIRLVALGLGLLLLTTLRSLAVDPVYVRFSIVYGYGNPVSGNIDVELRPDLSPNTVANFLTYVNSLAYNSSLIHRNYQSPDPSNLQEQICVIQGGGYTIAVANDQYTLSAIPSQTTTLLGEHVLSNTRGTIAMALSTGPNSATSEWFFNNEDDSQALDGSVNGGPFTAFGTIANSSSLAVMDQIVAVPVFAFNSPFESIPLVNYTTAEFNAGTSPTAGDFVIVNSITVLTQTYAAWQTANSTTGPSTYPQKDGVPNLLKYLCDVNPTGPMSASDRAALPVGGKTTISGTTYLTLTYRQNALKTGTTVNVQTSPDLQTWTTVTNPKVVQIGNDTSTTEGDPILQVQVPATGTRLFLRLNVTQP